MNRWQEHENQLSNVVSFNRNQRLLEETTKNRSRRKPRIIIVFICVMIVIVVVTSFLQTLAQNKKHQQTLVEAKDAALVAENRYEELEIEYKHSLSPEYLEQVARRDYYYSKPGEIIFELPTVHQPTEQAEFESTLE